MITFLQYIIKKLFTKPVFKILLVGMDKAGKTVKSNSIQ